MKRFGILPYGTTLQTTARTAGLASLAILATALGKPAQAGCLEFSAPQKPASESRSAFSGSSSAKFIRTDFRQVSEEQFGEHYVPAITGLWHFKYIAEGDKDSLNIDDDTVVDEGLTAWFADGNESTQSGMRPPTIGAICMGIWKQTGERTYVLNHLGLSWDPTPLPNMPLGESAGPAFIKQYVTLSRGGDTYTGTFSITQLNTDGVTLTMPAILGKIEATRIKLDTDTLPP
jgi:hypothetical protein